VKLAGLSAPRQVGLLVPAGGPLPRAAAAFADIARTALARAR
jgi:hypothetical protein